MSDNAIQMSDCAIQMFYKVRVLSMPMSDNAIQMSDKVRVLSLTTFDNAIQSEGIKRVDQN